MPSPPHNPTAFLPLAPHFLNRPIQKMLRGGALNALPPTCPLSLAVLTLRAPRRFPRGPADSAMRSKTDRLIKTPAKELKSTPPQSSPSRAPPPEGFEQQRDFGIRTGIQNHDTTPIHSRTWGAQSLERAPRISPKPPRATCKRTIQPNSDKFDQIQPYSDIFGQISTNPIFTPNYIPYSDH